MERTCSGANPGEQRADLGPAIPLVTAAARAEVAALVNRTMRPHRTPLRTLWVVRSARWIPQ